MKFILQLSIFLIISYRHERLCRRRKTIIKFCKKFCRSGFIFGIFCLFVLVDGFFPYKKRAL